MGDTFERQDSEPWMLAAVTPDPSTLTTVRSAPVPGATHILKSSGTPGDDSLYQFLVHDDDAPADFSPDLLRAIADHASCGLGTFRGRLPDDISAVRVVREPLKTDLYCADARGVERSVLTFYRRVWPGIPHEVQVLSTLVGPYSPDLIGHLEVEHDGATYILGTARRLPTGINAFEYSKRGAAAHVFSHSQGIILGQTLRFVHDSLLLAFPYEWRPASEVAAEFEARLDGFVDKAPVLAEFEPWIRDWYRSLEGEILEQRVHGSASFRRVWLEDDHTWFIGGWEGDLRLPLEERATNSCPLSDLATLQRSLFWACRGNKPWCIKTMESIFEGYGDPMMSRLFSAYVLDRACEELVEHSSVPDGEPEVCIEFFHWFVEYALPMRESMQPSQFIRP